MMIKFPVLLLTILQMHGTTITQLRDQNLIETTCKNTPNYQLCAATLAASPDSATADVEGLSLIMVDAIKGKAEEALLAIDELTWIHPELAQALQQCRSSYKAVLTADIPEAVAALKRGVPKFAESGMKDTAWEADICEGSFESVGESPMSGANKDLRDLAQVATSIIRNLL